MWRPHISSSVPSPSATPPDNEVYVRLLLPKGHGFPVWNPTLDRNLPIEYRQEGISAGDVGIINPDGSWDFLFNICVPGENPINIGGVPTAFEKVSDRNNVTDYQDHFERGCAIASNTMVSHKLEGDLLVQVNP
jgi:hypothetical protein